MGAVPLHPQVINAETAELRKHLLEQRMMEETERLHATVEDSRRAREASQRPMSSSDTARESKVRGRAARTDESLVNRSNGRT